MGHARWILPTVALALMFPLGAVAQQSDQTAVSAADDAYWRAYNTCDLTAMGPLLAPDAEFFHDKTGLTTTREGIVNSLRKGVCGTPGMHLRREAVPGSVQFHPLAGGYAMLTGQHRFYVTKPGSAEYLDGQADFTVVWKHAGDAWQMYRILSYGHGPAPYTPPKPSLVLSPAKLAAFAGHYDTPQAGPADIAVEGDHLRLKSKGIDLTLYPKTATSFFAAERDLRFEFTNGGKTMTVLEHGNPVAVGTRVSGAH